MSTKLEHFYIRAQSQNSSTGELELWTNPSTQEILMETDDVDVIYAEDYDALRSALEARYPHPVPNFSYVLMLQTRRAVGSYGYQAQVSTSTAHFLHCRRSSGEDMPLLPVEEVAKILASAARQYPCKYSTITLDSEYGFVCLDSHRLVDVMLEVGMLQVPGRYGVYYLATEQELEEARRAKAKQAEKVKRIVAQREQTGALTKQALLRCVSAMHTQLGLDTYYYYKLDYPGVVNAFLAGCVLFDRVHGKYAYRRSRPFQEILELWKKKIPATRNKMKKKSPTLYAFLEKEALVPKPRKLLPEVDKVDTLRTLDKAGRVLPSA